MGQGDRYISLERENSYGWMEEVIETGKSSGKREGRRGTRKRIWRETVKIKGHLSGTMEA